jgi:hypothetical protein
LQAEYAFTHWLAKVVGGPYFVDLIFRAGNGLCEVDDEWFQAAGTAEVLGRTLRICPAEEMIWQKAYIMERERFDGADVLHLLRMCAPQLDWKRLVRRFGPDWRVLLSHLILFGFVYPSERTLIPRSVLESLLLGLAAETADGRRIGQVCYGTLMSREQYLPDLQDWGYIDGRLDGRSRMTMDELRRWTEAALAAGAERGSETQNLRSPETTAARERRDKFPL